MAFWSSVASGAIASLVLAVFTAIFGAMGYAVVMIRDIRENMRDTREDLEEEIEDLSVEMQTLRADAITTSDLKDAVEEVTPTQGEGEMDQETLGVDPSIEGNGGGDGGSNA